MVTKRCTGPLHPDGFDLPIADFYKNVGRHDGLSGYCVACMSEINAALRKKLRSELLALLGDRCAVPRCPNEDPRGWCVDHVNGGGRAERAEVAAASRAFVERVRSNPDEYQILCAYHNQIKKVEEREHRGPDTYTRSIPTEKRQGIGNGNAPAQRAALERGRSPENSRKGAVKSWKGLTPEQRSARTGPMTATRSGTRKVANPDGNGWHWSKPGDHDYPASA